MVTGTGDVDHGVTVCHGGEPFQTLGTADASPSAAQVGSPLVQQLSGLDAGFLNLETPVQQGHIGGLVLIDPATAPGTWGFETLRRVSRSDSTCSHPSAGGS